MFAIARPMNSGVTKVNQRVDVLIGDGPDGPTLTAVAAARATFGDELLATKRGNTIAAFASVKFYKGLVDEFHGQGSMGE